MTFPSQRHEQLWLDKRFGFLWWYSEILVTRQRFRAIGLCIINLGLGFRLFEEDKDDLKLGSRLAGDIIIVNVWDSGAFFLKVIDYSFLLQHYAASCRVYVKHLKLVKKCLKKVSVNDDRNIIQVYVQRLSGELI